MSSGHIKRIETCPLCGERTAILDDDTRSEVHTELCGQFRVMQKDVEDLKSDLFDLIKLLDNEPALDTDYLTSMGWERLVAEKETTKP